MLLPPEIWREIVSHTVKKDVLKLETYPSINGCQTFKFIINDDVVIIKNTEIDSINRNEGNPPTCFLRTGCSLQELIKNINVSKKQCVLKFYDGGACDPAYNAVIISIDLTQNIFAIERDSYDSASKHSIQLEKNKEMIIKFLTDFKNAL